ncbi:hypothetical protein CHUAL_002346 [Chamberlinius hualienensis]
MPFSSLKGKVAIVTADANGDDLAKVAKECAEISEKFNISKPLIFIGDLSCETNREKLMEETIATFGKLDILANIAGICTPTSIFDKTMENVNKAVYDLCRLASHHLVKTKGSIINVGSVCGHHGIFDEVAKINATMKRAGEADEIAKVITFMISDENLYMNGSDVVVDGGFLVKKRDIPKIE